MEAEQFDRWYDNKVAEAIRKLPMASEWPSYTIRVPITFVDLMANMPIEDTEPQDHSTIHTIEFEKVHRGGCNDYYWDWKRTK